jgi:lysine 6-dehydrogenase
MSKIIVLGAGLIGSAMAIDLSHNHEVTISDLSKTAINNHKIKYHKINTKELDVTNESELQRTIKHYDLVVCAVPGYLGFNALKSIINAGMNVVDISFSPESFLPLDSLAKEKHVTAIVDCGVAPGLDNLILGRYNEKMKLSHFECLVGGLPKERKWPFSYKAPFSPVDVLEEYTRPARYVENGNIVVREPLTDCVYEYFEKVGTLESFNSDGLRSIIYTMSHIPNMKEKTLRYPQHAEYITVLKEAGFFSKDKIVADGTSMSPMEMTSKILFNNWKSDDTEDEFTVMRVALKGENEDGQPAEVIYSLYDEYCSETQTSSMARTTGYSATAAANMILDRVFTEKGVFPPELIGKHEQCFDYILKYLKERNIQIIKKFKVF